MLRRSVFWFIVFLPALFVCALLLLIAAAVMVIRITNDVEVFTQSATPVQELAREVYERHRSIWQAQRECIVFDEVLFYKPRPGECIFSNVEFSTILSFDHNGFRRTSPALKQDSKLVSGRVVVLGDSQAMGWGVQDGETFASVLAVEHGFEVFNLGVASYGTARELLRLRREFWLRSGDVVVIQYHSNDLVENLAFLNPEGMHAHSPADLGRLAHTPQSYGVFQVSASIAFIVKGWLTKALFPVAVEETLSRESPAEIFLSVLDRFPELGQVRLVVCEVDSFGHVSSFAEDLSDRSRGRLTVLKPKWDVTDFFRLDSHLNARGHLKLADLIAVTLQLAPGS